MSVEAPKINIAGKVETINRWQYGIAMLSMLPMSIAAAHDSIIGMAVSMAIAVATEAVGNNTKIRMQGG